MELLMLWVTFVTLVGGVPQIVKILRTKSTEDLSLASYWLWFSSSLAYTTYSMQFEDVMLKVAACIDLFMTSFILLLLYVYRKK